MFGSLSKQYGASPAALCKHSGLDPMTSKDSFGQSPPRVCQLGSCALGSGVIKEGRYVTLEKKEEG